jgi:hypothetical protein
VKPHLLLSMIFLGLMLASCNLGSPAPQAPADVATSAALTVEAVLSRPAASPTAAAQVTPTASPIPGAAIDGTTAESPSCEERAEIASWTRDGKTYDKAELDKPIPPGKGFVMTWIMKNTGDCVWDDRYKMIFDSGERLTSADTFAVMPFGYTVQPGESLTITIQMSAPSAPGSYESTFKFVNAEGDNVLITGVLTTVGTPSSGSITPPGDLRYQYSCSPGVVNITLTWKDRSDNEDGFRIYREGTKIADLPSGSTTYDDVLSAPGSYVYTVAAFNASGEAPINVAAETTNCQ